jgi:hypothetical protein
MYSEDVTRFIIIATDTDSHILVVIAILMDVYVDVYIGIIIVVGDDIDDCNNYH